MQIPMGGMDFFKDFVHDTRGDLYPLLEKSEDCTESVSENRYRVSGGSAERFFTQLFPFATYELTAESVSGEVGFVFRLPEATASITLVNGKDGTYLSYACADHKEQIEIPEAFTACSPYLSVTCFVYS